MRQVLKMTNQTCAVRLRTYLRINVMHTHTCDA